MKLSIIEIIFLLSSDITVVGILFYLYSQYHIIHSRMVYILIGFIFLLIIVRAMLFFIGNWFIYRRRINIIKEVVGDFKKGKFTHSLPAARIGNDLDEILNELMIAGRHLDSIMTAQKKEIDSLTRERVPAPPTPAEGGETPTTVEASSADDRHSGS